MSINCSGLQKSFQKRQIIVSVDLAVDRPSITCLVGHNGCGKTTLLKIMAGLQSQDQGTVAYFGQLLKRSAIRTLGITYASAQPIILNRTVAENLSYPLGIRGCEKYIIKERVDYYLDVLNLTAFRDRNALSLSAGEKQKLSLGRALILNPKVLLLDEPTANIDNKTLFEIESLLQQYVTEEKGYVVMATHDLEQAQRVGDTIYEMKAGALALFSKDQT